MSNAVAETVFDQLRAFGGYSFAKSHAAAFAVLVYQSAWLKLYHFAAFYAALLNNQPMGFWNPAVLVNEARRKGVAVRSVDIHHSQARCTVEGSAIRLGLNYVKAIGEQQIDRIVSERTSGPFGSLTDFCQRTRLGRRLVENLILAGAMDGWNIPRRQLLWELGALRYQEDELDLVFPSEPVPLPELSAAEAMLAEQSVLGLSTGDHVMTFYRDWLDRQGILGSRALASCADGQQARIAGLAVVHQSPPTAKGHHFLTLEDGDGMVNVIVRPHVYDRFRHTIHTAHLLIIEGHVQRQDNVVSFLAQRIRPLQ